jgi:ABC-type sugar transport system ATPase subunit
MSIKCSGLEIDIKYSKSEGKTVYIPAFELQKNQVLCLHFSSAMSLEEKEFIKYLRGEVKSQKIITSGSIIRVDSLEINNYFFNFFKTKKVKSMIKGLSEDEFIKNFSIICEELKININDDIKDLSFGQKKLLSIELAYYQKPDILIFDNAGLDPLNTIKIFNSIKRKLPHIGAIYCSYPCTPSRICCEYASQHLVVEEKE